MDRVAAATTLAFALLLSGCEAGPQARNASPLAVPAHGSTYHTATGTLASYDRARHVVVLQAAGAENRYAVAEDARVWLGARRVALAELGSYVGSEVTLAYGEGEDGERTTHTIRLREGHQR